jgi:hypothetical protein
LQKGGYQNEGVIDAEAAVAAAASTGTFANSSIWHPEIGIIIHKGRSILRNLD